ncbi:MAG TPA: lysylphosphatidylglycerol synthase transmembrane domain-containing protein [Silvibacterium sp.]|nr:lysylphosphatidylglycerol synthase transmembrane domain-containing protein [Silvibacterium sp.]
MKNKRWILWLIVAIALVALILVARQKIHFDWGTFVQQLKLADWRDIGIAVALIWFGYAIRAVRWALFLKPVRRTSPFSLLGTQIIGFTGVALLGRPADLVRPYLVAKRMQVTLSSQIAVYVVERMFDAGAMALIFSTALITAPHDASLPHPELLRKIAISGLVGTAALAALAVVVRLSGKAVATGAEKLFGMLSHNLGKSVGAKIHAFRDGLDMLASLRDVALALFYSLIMWAAITGAYLMTTRAFVDSPPLAGMTLARCMVLMAASMLVSAVQLPVIGWFTQIAALAATMQQFFAVRWEPALGCATVLLAVTFLSVIPLGLIWARIEHVSLKKVSEESENAGVEALAAPEAAPEQAT